MTDDMRELIERLRRGCKNPTGKRRPSPRELEAANALSASLAREEALREALRDELSALEADRRWANASELGGIITRCERMEAALQDKPMSTDIDKLLERLEARWPAGGMRNPDGPEAASAIRKLRKQCETAYKCLIQADLKIRSFPGADQSDVDFIRTFIREKE